MSRLLLVDDDRTFAQLACAALAREGFDVEVARSLFETRAAFGRSTPDVVILDRRLPDGDGIDLVRELRARAPDAAILMVTAHGDVQSAVRAMREGATDYLIKPVELVDLIAKARRSGERQRLQARLEQAQAELSSRHKLIRPRSEPMRRVLELLERVAQSPRSPVLLLGETGVGKEVLARHLHALSKGADAPFVHVNCAALPESMMESELFGHERGAFTDAKATRKGLVEIASGGTLFLDEIGELALPLQAKLLTYLDSGRFRRLGGSAETTSTARVVAATHRDLLERAGEARFREDLYYRLSVFRVDIPPLRERPEDIVPLAEGLLQSVGRELGRREATLGERAKERLHAYRFPGNVRELRNVIERALVLEPGPVLELDVLEGGRASKGEGFRVDGEPIALEELERRYVRYVLDRLGGKRGAAAQALGISYPTFLKKLGEKD